ncbi:hypothetical protein JKP88DRAFT_337642 [Tribonema minus]|uniref:Uncharacterized protein n=1 Tax=Tribonema minus TaxID=303371 RepID=A0A836C8Q2_9STRA|nr:hypothetical protein JKP88DRAFT_337642 [Tribonema minus]
MYSEPKATAGAGNGSVRSKYQQHVKTELRGYQERICMDMAKGNHLVVLPTGAGKTLVAAECIAAELWKQPTKRALFLVPTRNLVHQQAQVIEGETGLDVAELKGGNALRIGCRVLVATPGAYQQQGASVLKLASFSVIVVDEVHHTLGKHLYNVIARELRALPKSEPRPRIVGLSASPTYAVGEQQDCGPQRVADVRGGRTAGMYVRTIITYTYPGQMLKDCGAQRIADIRGGYGRIVGLSASPTYAVGERQVVAKLRNLCDVLSIDAVHSATSEELVASGYHAVPAAVIHHSDNVPLVLEDVRKAARPNDPRADHELQDAFLRSIDSGSAHPLLLQLMEVAAALEAALARADADFVSPLRRAGPEAPPLAKVKEWGGIALRQAEGVHAATPGLRVGVGKGIGDASAGLSTAGRLHNAYYEEYYGVPGAKRRAAAAAAAKTAEAAEAPEAESVETCHEPLYRALAHVCEAARVGVISSQVDVELSAAYVHMAWTTLGLAAGRCGRCGRPCAPALSETLARLAEDCGALLQRDAGWAPSPKRKASASADVLAGSSSPKRRASEAEGEAGKAAGERAFIVCPGTQTHCRRRHRCCRCCCHCCPPPPPPQHRITTHILNHFVASDAELSALFRSACAYAAGTPAAAGLRMSSTDLRDRFTNFRLGHFNLIFATCVAEEGLDLPCANCVIRFDPMHTPVSYVQVRM